MKRYFIFAALMAFLPMAYAMDSDGDGISDAIEASNGRDPFSQYSVSGSLYTGCGIDANGVTCWGGLDNGPALYNPTVVSSGYGACAIDDSGIVCWGLDSNWENFGLLDVPSMSNPVMVSVGGGHACALDESEVLCWGNNNYGQTDVPPLIDPVAVVTGSSNSCAIDASGLVCWGIGSYGSLDVPALDNPVAVSGDRDMHMCAIDDTGVVCWGENEWGKVSDVPSLSNPVAISTNPEVSCAIDDTGVVCWGANYSGQATPPPMTNPRALWGTSGDATCAIADEGLLCWGDNSLFRPPLNFQFLLSSLLVPDVTECSRSNAAEVEVSVLNTNPGEPIITIHWFLDGESQGYGNNIDITAPLGRSTLMVGVTYQSGETTYDSKVITVEDTKKPKLLTRFTDHKGNEIAADDVNHEKKIYFSHSASDVCDPDVASETILGAELDQAAWFDFDKKKDKVKIESQRVVIKAVAEDASGNRRKRKFTVLAGDAAHN